jgi:TonB family protein
LRHAKAKNVVVLDFASPVSSEWNLVGQKLAEDMRAELAAADRKLKIVPNAKLVKAIEADAIEQTALASPSVGFYATRDVKPDGWVVGELREIKSDFKISLHVFTGKKHETMTDIAVAISRSPELTAMIVPRPPDPFPDVPWPPKDGNAPACTYCPQAEYSQAAVAAKLQGVVTLWAVVRADGTLDRIQVQHGLPLGLNEKAIAALKMWKLQPATDAGGKPIAVRQLIEVQFHLFGVGTDAELLATSRRASLTKQLALPFPS